MIPKSIIVRGRKWLVKFVEDLQNEDGVKSAGLCCDKTKTIEINKGMTADQIFEVFVHEWLHSVWFECGIDDEGIPQWVEHWFVNAIAKDMAIHAKLWAKIFDAYTKK